MVSFCGDQIKPPLIAFSLIDLDDFIGSAGSVRDQVDVESFQGRGFPNRFRSTYFNLPYIFYLFESLKFLFSAESEKKRNKLFKSVFL